MEGLLKNCRVKNQLLRECLAEFLGVYVLIVSKDTRRMLKSPLNLETVYESTEWKTEDFVPKGQKEGELVISSGVSLSLTSRGH